MRQKGTPAPGAPVLPQAWSGERLRRVCASGAVDWAAPIAEGKACVQGGIDLRVTIRCRIGERVSKEGHARGSGDYSQSTSSMPPISNSNRRLITSRAALAINRTNSTLFNAKIQSIR